MTTSTSGGVDLDQVLLVADDLRRNCHRAVKMGVSFGEFNQERWEAALAHVKDLNARRQPRISSHSASTASWPTVHAQRGGGST